jgi:hypothetical protein
MGSKAKQERREELDRLLFTSHKRQNESSIHIKKVENERIYRPSYKDSTKDSDFLQIFLHSLNVFISTADSEADKQQPCNDNEDICKSD